MKKSFTTVLLMTLIISQALIAKDNIILTATYNKNFYQNSSYDMVGINLEIFVTKYVSLNYSVLLGGNGKQYALHSTGGVVGGFHLIGYALDALANEENESSSFGYGVSTVFALMLPEGINVHVPLSQYVSLVPFVHPLGYEYIGNERTISSSIGLKVMYNIDDKLLVVPQIGTTLFYANEEKTSYNLGLSIGYRF